MSFVPDNVACALHRSTQDSRNRVRILRWWLSDHWRMPHYLAGIVWC